MVINAGKYTLQPDFAENFLPEFDNGVESVFAIQYSVNDGTSLGRMNFVTGLNYPHGAPRYGCCGFHQPTQNLANAFGTDANGLPKFDTFNEGIIDFSTATVDPRVDHTIGIDGHSYKYNAALPFSKSWVRDPGVYGFFQSMKEQQLATSSSYKKQGPFIGSSKNIDIIRYADVLLFQAEAYIELGQQALALPLINKIRERAARSTGRTKKADGTDSLEIPHQALRGRQLDAGVRPAGAAVGKTAGVCAGKPALLRPGSLGYCRRDAERVFRKRENPAFVSKRPQIYGGPRRIPADSPAGNQLYQRAVQAESGFLTPNQTCKVSKRPCRFSRLCENQPDAWY